MNWKPAQYRGWDSIECRTNGVRINIVPQLGGRIVNYQLEDHEFLWINPVPAGSTPPPTRLDPEGGWLNWGGDKVWIAPQGWNDKAHWPGPPDPVLDGGPYRVDWIDDSEGGGVRLTSETSAASGMQLSRLLQMEKGSSRLRVTATMTNIGEKARRWGIWPVTQIDASARTGQGWNSNLRAYVPAHPTSADRDAYRVLGVPGFFCTSGVHTNWNQRGRI